jgi:hypothetical protein
MRGTADIADMVLHVAQGKVAQVDVQELETLRKYARKLFEALDTDFDNLVTRSEFISAVRNAPWAVELLGVTGCDTGDEELGQMFDLLDRSSNGEVDFDELVQFLRLRFEDDLPEVLEILHHLETGTEAPKNASKSKGKQVRRSNTCPSLDRGSSFGAGSRSLSRSLDKCPSPLRPQKAFSGGFNQSAAFVLDSSRWQIPEVAREMPIPSSKHHALLVEPRRCASHQGFCN